MKNSSALFIASVFLLCGSTAANAHRLNVFAYSQAHEICVETSFQGGKPARGADVRVLTEEGTVFLTAKTEQDGKVCMALPDGFEPAPLTVIVNAGEGHQNQWKLSKEDFTFGADSKTAVSTVKLEIPNKEAETNTTSPKIYSQEELDAALKAAREQAEMQVIAPLRKQLAEAQQPKITWRVCLPGFRPADKKINDIKKGFFSGFEDRICACLRSGRFSAAEYHGSALRAVLFLFDHFSLPNRR